VHTRGFQAIPHAKLTAPVFYKQRGRVLSINVAWRVGSLAAALACVFELWHCFECVLGCAGKNELSILELELLDRDSHVVLAKTQEAARADDGIGDEVDGASQGIEVP